MGSTFNPQILMEKLAKLNSSQASIENWCIFHMHKAKQVVETWARQFHCSHREQRVAFLYLANDILQNSRRKGSEFVGEFWKVLPDALRDVVANGDEFGKNAALRLIGIWEERKVFGSRGQLLKEELLGKHLEATNRNGRHVNVKLKQPAGATLDKIVSGYQAVYGGQMVEDTIFSKCRNAISCLENLDKEIGNKINSGQFHGPAIAEELQGQRDILRDGIEQLITIESSRSSLVSQLREALQEQESKLEEVRNQLQAVQSQSENAGNTCEQLLRSNNVQVAADLSSKEAKTSISPKSFVPGEREQSAYARQVSFPEKTGHVEEDPRKSAAAAVAAKLTASSSSAEMLSYVLSSLASEGVIGNAVKESSGEYHPEKRAKLEMDQPYIPTQSLPQHPLPPFQRTDSFSHVPTTAQQTTPGDPPPPPSSPPPPPPPPPMPQYSMTQYVQHAGSINGMQYSYGLSQQSPPPLPGYPTSGMPMTGITPYTMPQTNAYQSYQGTEGNLYSQQSSMPPMAPMTRQ